MDQKDNGKDTMTEEGADETAKQDKSKIPSIKDRQDMWRRQQATPARLSANRFYDDKVLKQAVEDAGRWAYGVVLVEVWALSDNQECLFRPPDGWWAEPACLSSNEALARLTDPSRADYVPALPLCPGEGLPGLLWAEASGGQGGLSRMTSLISPDIEVGESRTYTKLRTNSNRIIWRDVRQLALDPDQPWNPRLQLFMQLELGYAAAVPFDFNRRQGLVIYVARSNVDGSRLQADTNQEYLQSASDLIGAAFALRGPRHKVEVERRKELHSALRRVKNRILTLTAMNMSLAECVKEEEKKNRKSMNTQLNEMSAEKSKNTMSRFFRLIVEKAASSIKKAKGGCATPPPSFVWSESLLTFVGVFLTMMTVTGMNTAINNNLGSAYKLSLGPFGALMTLLYGLTAAPASQPRNAVLGQFVSMTVSVALSYAQGLDLWLKQCLAPALAISIMTKLGITHPPGGASSIIFVDGTWGWGNMAFMIIANIAAVVMSALINNVSTKRQYPSYWTGGYDKAVAKHTTKMFKGQKTSSD